MFPLSYHHYHLLISRFPLPQSPPTITLSISWLGLTLWTLFHQNAQLFILRLRVCFIYSSSSSRHIHACVGGLQQEIVRNNAIKFVCQYLYYCSGSEHFYIPTSTLQFRSFGNLLSDDQGRSWDTSGSHRCRSSEQRPVISSIRSVIWSCPSSFLSPTIFGFG